MTTPTPAAQPTARTQMTEETQARYIGELMRREHAGERNTVHIGPYSLMVTIGALQLALRSMPGDSKTAETIRALVAGWRQPFAGTAGSDIIDRGFDPAHDGDGRDLAVPAGYTRWWSCEPCKTDWDATAYRRPDACPHCAGPITATLTRDGQAT